MKAIIEIGTELNSTAIKYVIVRKTIFGFVLQAKNGDKLIKNKFELNQMIERGTLKVNN
jgi:hypothetical protein